VGTSIVRHVIPPLGKYRRPVVGRGNNELVAAISLTWNDAPPDLELIAVFTK
jgi:hypothetical protein